MWYFKNVWLKWRYRSLPFKMKNWAETQKSDCIEDTLNDLKVISKNFNNDYVRFKIKEKKDDVLNYNTNLLGDRVKMGYPIFTQNEIASITTSSHKEVFIIVIFVCFEGIIFSQLINLMIPREVHKEFWWISIIVGIILSVLIVFAVKNALGYYYEYIEALSLLKKGENAPDKLKRFILNRNIAYIIIIMFLLFSIAAGFLREFVLLGAAADKNPFMGKMVFFMSILLSIMVVVVLALIENELRDKKMRSKVFKNAKRHEKERKEYITSLREIYSNAQKALYFNLEKYWNLVLDLQRIFGNRYDGEDEVIYTEYNKKIAAGEIKPGNLDDDIYFCYRHLQSCEEGLFKYGILRNAEIKALMKPLKDAYDQVIELEKGYKHADDIIIDRKIVANPINTSIILLFVACMATMMLSCKPKSVERNIVCYIDFSDTPDRNERMINFERIVDSAVIMQLDYNTHLTILPVDKASATGSTELLTAIIGDEFDFIPQMTPAADEQQIASKNLQLLKDTLVNRFKDNFASTLVKRQGLEKGTDIFGALQQATRYLKEGDGNLIIFLSDMMNWSSDIKLEPGNYDPGQKESALKKMPRVLLPANAKVIIYTGNLGYISQQHYAAVNTFWDSYFKQNNIRLLDYSSGAVSALQTAILEH